ncbi:MAG: hypothetical protein ACKVT1_06220 [Dehalococcoidia bacterium]
MQLEWNEGEPKDGLRILEYMPADFRLEPGVQGFYWIWLHAVVGIDLNQLAVRDFRQGDALALVRTGIIPYPRDTATLDPWRGGPPSYAVGLNSAEWNGSFCLTVVRQAQPRFDGDRNNARLRASALVSLIRLLIGRAVAVDSVGEGYISHRGVLCSQTPPVPDLALVPGAIPTGAEVVTAAISKIDPDADLGKRVTLALRWMDKSRTVIGNEDSFVAGWIAIETLTMKGTNIDPVCIALGQIYGIPSKKAKERFCVGLLCGLRGSIVHSGKQVDVSPSVLHLLEALFEDLLLDKLGVESRHRAAWVVDKTNVVAEVHALTGKP